MYSLYVVKCIQVTKYTIYVFQRCILLETDFKTVNSIMTVIRTHFCHVKNKMLFVYRIVSIPPTHTSDF